MRLSFTAGPKQPDSSILGDQYQAFIDVYALGTSSSLSSIGNPVCMYKMCQATKLASCNRFLLCLERRGVMEQPVQA